MDTAHAITHRFIDALHTLEREGDVGALSELVTSEAPVVSLDGAGGRTGPEGMQELFTQYLAQFETIETTFTAVTESETRAALEWTSAATLKDGHDLTYDGVTILDLEDERVSRFRTIYDSAAFVRPPGETE